MNQIPSVWVETEKCKACGGMLVLVENDEICCFNCDSERVDKFYAPKESDPYPITEEMLKKMEELSKDFVDLPCDEDDDL